MWAKRARERTRSSTIAGAKIEAQRRPGPGRRRAVRTDQVRGDTSRAPACLVHVACAQREGDGMPVCRRVCVARACGGGLRGLTTRIVLGGQCVPSMGCAKPMRVPPRFRSSVVCAARLTRRPKEGGCWPLGWILSTFSSRAAAVRARLARAVCLWAVGGERQRRGEAARTAADGEPG